MKNITVVRKKILFSFIAAFFLAVLSFAIYSFIRAGISLGELEGWDGITVNEFKKGNGTKENPYLIEDASEFMYFKSLIEGENSNTYQEQYFALEQDIDFNGNEITPIGVVVDEEERIFRGHLEGHGHKLTNFKISEPVTIGEEIYYSLFTKVENASFSSLEVSNYTIECSEGDNLIISPFIGKNIDSIDENVEDTTSDYYSIYLHDFYIDTSKVESLVEISPFIKEVNNANIQKIIMIGEVNSIGEIQLSSLPKANLVIDGIHLLNSELTFNHELVTEYFTLKDGEFYRDEEIVSNELLLSLLNDENQTDSYWDIEDGTIVMKQYEKVEEVPEPSKSFTFSIRRSAAISLHDSGTEGTTVYINDLEADYNHYMGLNYTESNNGHIGNGSNQSFYSDSNLVAVYMAYRGHPIDDDTITGKVSLTENYTDFIYYKYYPVSNGSIKIPLIDNPYGSRPTDLAFNGWITDYENAVVSFDLSTYTRYVTIPATTGPISITMYATWTEVTKVNASVNNYVLDTSNLKDARMTPIVTITPIYAPGVVLPTTSYLQYSMSSGTSFWGTSYPNGAVDQNGNSLNGSYCTPSGNWWNGYTARTCYYFLPVDQNSLVPGQQYYYLYRNNMTLYTVPTPVDYNYDSIFDIGDNYSGFYRKVNFNSNQSYAGYYSDTGVYQSSGTCYGTCTYYELVQYSDQNLITADNFSSLYYLVTRDTNIALVDSDINGFSNSKPVTVTGIHNNTNRTNRNIRLDNRSIRAGADLRIDYVQLYSDQYTTNTNGPASSNYNYVYGNFYNIRIGRGLTIRTSGNGNNRRYYFNARGVVAGNDDGVGSAGNAKKYHMIVESGYYNATSGMGNAGSSATYYTQGYTTYGCDLDRVKNANTNLQIYYTSAATWGGYINSTNNVTNFMSTTIKSGTFGQATSESASGVYVGGLNGGSIYAPASLTVEGGDILYLNGGPLVDSSMAAWNSIYINFKGGEADYIFGGAARSLTHGNRIINFTGGNVNFSVFGGSNGYNGDDNQDTNRGTLNGSTLIYVGGKAKVLGNANPPFNAESGSVFGAGNGRSNSTKIGSVNNSTIVIGADADIKNNVYGGGNYGAVSSQSGNTSVTKINILGGAIKGSVYGGGNNNGSGSDTVNTSIAIQMSGGTVDKSIYGGSRAKGRVYGGTSVTIHGGTVKQDVYGGGEGGYTNSTDYGTYVRDDVNVLVDGGQINGSVYGGSAYGTVNAIDQTTDLTGARTNVTINGGVIADSVFGGAKGNATYTPKVIGNITVIVNNGSCGKVFGGFDASGKPNAGDVVYLYGGTVGSAFGGGNNANQDTTNIHLQGTTITGNLYGGSNLLGTVTTSNVFVSSGKVTDIYGGNNLDGLTITTNVSVTGGTIQGDVYGGGNQAASTTTNVEVNGVMNINNVYGGGNQAGVSNRTRVNIGKGTINGVYGGSNQSGTVSTTNVQVGPNLSNFYDDYTIGGSGLEVSFNYRFSSAQYQTSLYPEYQTIVDITPVFTNTTGEDFDEWSVTITVPDSTFFVHDGDANIIVNGDTYTWNQDDRWWGTNPIPAGSTYSPSLPLRVLFKGTQSDFRLIYDLEAIDGDNGVHRTTNDPSYVSPTLGGGINIGAIYGGNNIGGTVTTSNVLLNNGTVGEIYGGGNRVGLTTSNVEITGGTITSVYGGSNISGNVTTSNVTVGGESAINITNLYGGNNLGGVTTTANIEGTSGTITTIYGGGNEASVGSTHLVLDGVNSTTIYGGGNAAGVTGNTSLDIDNCIVEDNIYGGGNEGIVQGSTVVTVTDSHIKGNAFAGGNGSTAIVYQNSTITIDGTTVIGLPTSEAPNEGCVFGSGNAASTGLQNNNNSVATVNLVGGTVYGNVYGGPKMAIVYGKTYTNIGTAAVSNTNLTEDNIHIYGTVFGGGESNADGNETYDWNFVSVTDGITLNIDGTDYDTNQHTFIINGSIFGSGNASTSSGESKIFVKNLGSISAPNRAISIQRTNYLEIESSAIELMGATDRTNDNATILYSFNMIDKMVIKNGTTLFLQHNANVLKELYSGVDSNGTLVPAVVDIDDNTKTVTKNVDNRIYTISGQNLNVTTNQAATTYGKITGMTFFGMYNSYDNGTYRLGLYDPSLNYGDAGNASLEIVGGSYVLGLKQTNHDITKDGFYSNYIDEETNANIKTAYIDPTPIGDLGYRWILGFDAISYEFELFASRYSSLGTYELQMFHFSEGDTYFNVLGFDSSGLNPEISLVDSNEVPRIGTTEAEANNILGLSLKAETQEWTGYGTTKLLSRNNGEYTGTREYLTDSRKLPPSLMVYLYHTKNISRVGNMGTVVVTLQAAIPKNAIDYEIKFITITMHLLAVHVDADSYDASITYDKKYEFTSATSVNITNQSQFTTYFSLTTFNDDFTKIYGNNNDYFHVLVTNNPLPVNTMITMLDYGIDPTHPKYYYYKVTQSDYNDSLTQISTYHEATYRLSKFIAMDSTSTTNTYNDAASNLQYYDSSAHFVDEEFIFIFDFKDCTHVTGNHLNNSILFELRTSEDRTKFNVYGLREPLMVYNTYESSNVVLDNTFTDVDSYLYYDIPDEFSYSTLVHYDETDNRESVIDTNYESSKMGLNVTFFNSDGEPVSSSMLVGTNVKIGNQMYFADADGVFRIKLANKVSNLNRECSITVNDDLPAGQYTIRYSLFASDDGLHNSSVGNATVTEFTVTVVSADNSIVVDCNDDTKLVFGETSLNHGGSNINYYTVRYQAALNNPNFRVEVLKRKTNTVDATEYESVPFSQLFKNVLNPASGNEVYITMDTGQSQTTFNFVLQDNLISGTYKVLFKLYDNNQLIDEDVKYVIVQKKLE